MSDFYKLVFVVFMVLAFILGFIVNISRFDLKTATVNTTNKLLDRYVELLDTRITRMLEVKGKVVFDTTGFYLSPKKFSKRNRLTLGESESFFYFEKDISAQFTIQKIEEDGVVISYEARWADKSSGAEAVTADSGIFKIGWKF